MMIRRRAMMKKDAKGGVRPFTEQEMAMEKEGYYAWVQNSSVIRYASNAARKFITLDMDAFPDGTVLYIPTDRYYTSIFVSVATPGPGSTGTGLYYTNANRIKFTTYGDGFQLIDVDKYKQTSLYADNGYRYLTYNFMLETEGYGVVR